MDHGLAYEALSRGSIDVADAYSTDAKISRYGLTLLTDDRNFFPSYEAVYVYRTDAARRAPRAIAAIRALSGTIDEASIARLNAEAEIDGRTFSSIAAEFLRTRAGADGAAVRQGREPLFRGMLSVIRAEGPTARSCSRGGRLRLATLIGLPLGIFARRERRIGRVIIGATSIAQTIPALALLCFFIPLAGHGHPPGAPGALPSRAAP